VAQKARRMAERLYDVLVGATVHDMLNMVTPLESSIVSLQKKVEDRRLEPSDLTRHLPRMRRQVEWLSRMLDDMKTYSQCTPGRRRRERVEAIVEEAAAMARDTLKAADRLPDQVRLEMDLARGLTLVVARDHAVRAVSNIIKNAYEAFAVSPTEYRSGEIHVTARTIDSQRLEIVVKDNGLGLSEDDLADARRFVPGGTSKAGFGTGFGLPTARRMIEAHGGSWSSNRWPPAWDLTHEQESGRMHARWSLDPVRVTWTMESSFGRACGSREFRCRWPQGGTRSTNGTGPHDNLGG